MFKILMMSGSLACLLSVSSIARSQALPTATANGFLQAGLGATYAKPDYGDQSIEGVSGWLDLDVSPHFGVELGFHYVSLITPADLGENSYYIGPRVLGSFAHGKIQPYGKALVGIGSLVIQEVADNQGRGNGTYFYYGAGGGLDILVGRHLTVRAIDGEYQRWPGLGNGLTPLVATIGVAYRFR